MKHEELDAKLRDHLERLRLPYMAEHYREVLDEAAREHRSPLQTLALLVEGEVQGREERSLERRLRSSCLPKEKTIAEYDFQWPKRIAKQKLLRYFDGEFIREATNLVIAGTQGLGKTHLLTALGYTACRFGLDARFTRVVDMINDLVAAQRDGSLGRALRTYTKPDLLLLDELGYLPVDKRGADLLFQVVAARYECRSIVISTNRCFSEWTDVFDGDATLATAMIDRLMHHGERIRIEGKSYRTKDQDPEQYD